MPAMLDKLTKAEPEDDVEATDGVRDDNEVRDGCCSAEGVPTYPEP